MDRELYREDDTKAATETRKNGESTSKLAGMRLLCCPRVVYRLRRTAQGSGGGGCWRMATEVVQMVEGIRRHGGPQEEEEGGGGVSAHSRDATDYPSCARQGPRLGSISSQ